MNLWEQIAPHLPDGGDIGGWSVLEIGGRGAGDFAARGARVSAIAAGPDVYSLASSWGRHDMILCLDGLGALRYPRLALDILARKTKRLLLLRGDEAMLAGSGLCVRQALDGGLLVCAPTPAQRAAHDAEYAAAAGENARLARTLRFAHCWVNITPGYTETCYHDGTRVPAAPEDSEGYRANAARFGYGDDLAGLSREHEVLHTFLAEARTGGASPTLWAVAHGQAGDVAPVWEQEEEEAVVLAFQTYLHGGPFAAPLEGLAFEGLDVVALREEARALLR